MRIVIDIDGTISELRKEGQSYSEVKMIKGAASKIKSLKKEGHYIILYSARHMKSCNGNIEDVKKKIGKITIDWLKRNNIPYDELHFGKPYGEVYIDDLGQKFDGWNNIHEDKYRSKELNILIPMAGIGSRFVKAGYKIPKPLIKTHGKMMVEWALKSFDSFKKNPSIKPRFIFVVLKKHIEKYKIDKLLSKKFGMNSIIVSVKTVTRGQAETALAAKKYIDNFSGLIIYNCDTFSTFSLTDLIEQENPDGAIGCFNSKDRRYSYAKIDKYGYVSKTAEKKVISNLATNGMYYFKRGSDFVQSAEVMISENKLSNGEFFVAPCYNLLIKIGKKVRPLISSENWVLGTPEEMRFFEKNYKNDGK